MSAEYKCQYLVFGNNCCFRVMNEHTTIMPKKAEIVDDIDEDIDSLDVCIPARWIPISSTWTTDERAKIITEQLECDKYESSEGREPFVIV